VEDLASRLRDIARQELMDRDPVREIRIDLEVSLERLGPDLLRWLGHLAPFGAGNPNPVILTRRVELKRATRVGNDGSHLKLQLEQHGHRIPAIGFGLGKRLQEARDLVAADAALVIAENRWQGRREVQARLLDFRPSET
jgi:single-stranded-DNA-specific exonuclease